MCFKDISSNMRLASTKVLRCCSVFIYLHGHSCYSRCISAMYESLPVCLLDRFHSIIKRPDLIGGNAFSEVHPSFDSSLLSQENGLEGELDINTNTREQGFEDVSQAQFIDGKAKGRATTEVDIMRGGANAATDANTGQLQVSKRDSKSASDQKSSKKGKGNQESLQSSKGPRLEKTSCKKLLDVKAAITTLSRGQRERSVGIYGNVWKQVRIRLTVMVF